MESRTVAQLGGVEDGWRRAVSFASFMTVLVVSCTTADDSLPSTPVVITTQSGETASHAVGTVSPGRAEGTYVLTLDGQDTCPFRVHAPQPGSISLVIAMTTLDPGEYDLDSAGWSASIVHLISGPSGLENIVREMDGGILSIDESEVGVLHIRVLTSDGVADAEGAFQVTVCEE